MWLVHSTVVYKLSTVIRIKISNNSPSNLLMPPRHYHMASEHTVTPHSSSFSTTQQLFCARKLKRTFYMPFTCRPLLSCHSTNNNNTKLCLPHTNAKEILYYHVQFLFVIFMHTHCFYISFIPFHHSIYTYFS